jgi:hypothetical protein
VLVLVLMCFSDTNYWPYFHSWPQTVQLSKCGAAHHSTAHAQHLYVPSQYGVATSAAGPCQCICVHVALHPENHPFKLCTIVWSPQDESHQKKYSTMVVLPAAPVYFCPAQ